MCWKSTDSDLKALPFLEEVAPGSTGQRLRVCIHNHSPVSNPESVNARDQSVDFVLGPTYLAHAYASILRPCLQRIALWGCRRICDLQTERRPSGIHYAEMPSDWQSTPLFHVYIACTARNRQRYVKTNAYARMLKLGWIYVYVPLHTPMKLAIYLNGCQQNLTLLILLTPDWTCPPFPLFHMLCWILPAE
jgi:hypothetical protein